MILRPLTKEEEEKFRQDSRNLYAKLKKLNPEAESFKLNLIKIDEFGDEII